MPRGLQILVALVDISLIEVRLTIGAITEEYQAAADEAGAQPCLADSGPGSHSRAEEHGAQPGGGLGVG